MKCWLSTCYWNFQGLHEKLPTCHCQQRQKTEEVALQPRKSFFGKDQRSGERPPRSGSGKPLVDCCLIEIQQAAEMSHSLKGSFIHPWEPPIISIIPKRKHFQWNSAIKRLCSHVNCFLYLAKQKRAGCTFFLVLWSLSSRSKNCKSCLIQRKERTWTLLWYQNSLYNKW